jgi:hypothetical protein
VSDLPAGLRVQKVGDLVELSGRITLAEGADDWILLFTLPEELGHAQKPADHAEGGLLGEPGDDVLEVAGEARSRSCPGDRFGHHPLAARAAEPAQLALQEAAARAKIEVPPAPPLAPVIACPAQAAAARADEPPPTPAQPDHHPLALEADAF